MSAEKTIKAKECRFAFHIPTRSKDFPDLHLVKEVIHYEDGTTEPNVRFVFDFKRSFWVTQKKYRNHEQKKEREYMDKVTAYSCTQSDLRFQVAKALDQGYSPLPLDRLAASPYLYGTDISSTSIIKYQYQKKYPDIFTKYSVATFDIETDVLEGHGDPLMATIVMRGKMFMAVLKSFVSGYSDVSEVYHQKLYQHLGEYVKELNLDVELMVVDHTTDIIIECLRRLHKWSPDMVMIWNIGFDIPRCLDTLKKYGKEPADYFCDPRVPYELRYCRYKKGSTKKITASGQVKPKNPSEQWHSLICPAGFQFIDQMSAYRFLRLGSQEEQEYGLDYLLDKHLGVRKLNFKEAAHISKGLEWHRFMQSKYPIEYMVYNNFDCIGTILFEEKLNDISMAAPSMVGITDFSRLDSQTKRFADAYHFYLLEEHNSVIGTIPPSEKKDINGETEEEADYIGDSEDDESGEEDEDSDEAELRDVLKNKDTCLSLRGWIKYYC